MRVALCLLSLIFLGSTNAIQSRYIDDSAILIKQDLQTHSDGEEKMSQLSAAILSFDANASEIAKRMGKSALPELESLMQHKDSAVRSETTTVLAELDLPEAYKLILQATNDEDQNVVNAAVYQIEVHQDWFPTPLLSKLMQNLTEPNAIKRIILLLGSRLNVSESPTLEPYCDSEQDKIVTLACVAALAKIGVQQRREQFSVYLQSAHNDMVELNTLFNLVDYIHQPWILPSLRLLLNNKSEIQSLGDVPPSFPSILRVCDKVVPLIAKISQAEFTFRTDLHANYTDTQLREVEQAVSAYRY
jgi:hypothetical protein